MQVVAIAFGLQLLGRSYLLGYVKLNTLRNKQAHRQGYAPTKQEYLDFINAVPIGPRRLVTHEPATNRPTGVRNRTTADEARVAIMALYMLTGAMSQYTSPDFIAKKPNLKKWSPPLPTPPKTSCSSHHPSSATPGGTASAPESRT